MVGIKMTKKFLSFNLCHYLFGDFSLKCVEECSRKGCNIGQQRHNFTITVTGAHATTKNFGPLGGYLSGSRTSENVPVRERKEHVISTKCQLVELIQL